MAKPKLTPTADDLAREAATAADVVANPPGAVFQGWQRGKTKDVAWRTNVAYWRAYDLPPQKIAKGDTAAANAWRRIEQLVNEAMYAGPDTPAKTWNPDAVTWPLPTPPTGWPSGSKFAAKRPWSGKQTRYHTGVDLAAEAGTPVLAPEAGRIVAPDSGWDFDKKTGKGVKALIMSTDSGRTILLGGIRPGSSTLKAGQEVGAGEKVAEVGRYKGGSSMLHVNLYDKVLTEAQVNAQKKWVLDGKKPPNLIDPAPYLEEAAKNPKYVMLAAFNQGDEPGLVENDVEGGEQTEGEEDAVADPAQGIVGDPKVKVVAAGGRTGEKPCGGQDKFDCTAEDVAAWRAALLLYWQEASAAVQRAKGSGKTQTPEAGAAAASVAAVQQLLENPLDVQWWQAVPVYVDACRLCVESAALLDAFAGKSAKKKKGSSGMLIAAGVGLTLVGVGVAVMASRGKRRTQKSLAL